MGEKLEPTIDDAVFQLQDQIRQLQRKAKDRDEMVDMVYRLFVAHETFGIQLKDADYSGYHLLSEVFAQMREARGE